MDKEVEAGLIEADSYEAEGDGCGGDIHQTYHLQLGDPWYRGIFYAIGIVAALKYILWG